MVPFSPVLIAISSTRSRLLGHSPLTSSKRSRDFLYCLVILWQDVRTRNLDTVLTYVTLVRAPTPKRSSTRTFVHFPAQVALHPLALTNNDHALQTGVERFDKVARFTATLCPLLGIGGRSLLGVIMKTITLVDIDQHRGVGASLAGRIHLVQDVSWQWHRQLTRRGFLGYRFVTPFGAGPKWAEHLAGQYWTLESSDTRNRDSAAATRPWHLEARSGIILASGNCRASFA